MEHMMIYHQMFCVFQHFPKGYGSIPINTIIRGMNIHLPAILMFTRGTQFWHTAKSVKQTRRLDFTYISHHFPLKSPAQWHAPVEIFLLFSKGLVPRTWVPGLVKRYGLWMPFNGKMVSSTMKNGDDLMIHEIHDVVWLKFSLKNHQKWRIP